MSKDFSISKLHQNTVNLAYKQYKMHLKMLISLVIPIIIMSGICIAIGTINLDSPFNLQLNGHLFIWGGIFVGCSVSIIFGVVSRVFMRESKFLSQVSVKMDTLASDYETQEKKAYECVVAAETLEEDVEAMNNHRLKDV